MFVWGMLAVCPAQAGPSQAIGYEGRIVFQPCSMSVAVCCLVLVVTITVPVANVSGINK